MALSVVFRSSAREDLASILLHIAKDSVSRGEAFVDRIEACCLQLAEFPAAGRIRDDLGDGFRTIAFERRVLIVYVTAEVIEIVRVLYGGRDVEALIAEGE